MLGESRELIAITFFTALEARGVSDPDAALEHAVEVATDGRQGRDGGESSDAR